MGVDVREKLKLFFNTYIIELVKNDSHNIILKMQFKSKCSEDIYTKYYPQTFSILSSTMPSVLCTKCFNDQNLPFKDEVLDTELGHLFEHIIIQKLTDLNSALGINAIFDGYTSWDWAQNEYGVFDISISSIERAIDPDIFNLAMLETIDVFNKILFNSYQRI